MKRMYPLAGMAVLTSVVAAAAAYYLQGRETTVPSAAPLQERAGMALAIEKGCIACHSLDGTAGIGPTWQGTYGTLRTLSDGSQVTADENYLGRSIREPAAQVVKGYENIMIAPELSDAELGQLLLLIRELGTAGSE